MSYRLKFVFPYIFGVLSLASQLQAAPSTWTAAAMTDDLNTAGNWSAGIPTGDVATFPSTASSLTPDLQAGTLNFSQAIFPNNTAYDLSILGSGTELSFGTTPSSGVGVTNVLPAAAIHFMSNNFSQITFNGSSSADSNNTGLVYYQLGMGNDVGNMAFNDSSTAGGTASAPGAQITVGNFEGGPNIGGGNLLFNNASTAGYSTLRVGQNVLMYPANIIFNGDSSSVFSSADHAMITVGDFENQFNGSQGAVSFNSYATAANASINAGSLNTISFLSFNDNSTAGDSLINVGNTTAGTLGGVFFQGASLADNARIFADNYSLVDFNDDSQGQDTAISLTNNSMLTLGVNSIPVQSLTIGSLTSDASSTVNLFAAPLTVNYNGVTPITVAGVINDLGNGMTSLGGSLIKNGSGTLVLSGANTYTGLTTANQGNLTLNGSIPGFVLVNPGALFSGTGTVGGTVTVSGGIAPGNSIGTMTVGNLVQNAGSIYYLELDGAGNTDLINVTGSATLNGGQVVVTSLDGTALIDTPYTILITGSGVTGQFAGVSTTNLLLIPTLSYVGNDVLLTFAQTVFDFDAVTPNQIAVATQLESITNPTAEEYLILRTLESLPAEEQQRALDQMSGEQYASLNLATEIAGRQFLRRLYDPLRSIVTTEPCYDPCSCDYQCPTLDLWFEAGGGQTTFDGNNNAHGLKLSGYEVTLGAQSTFNQVWTVGAAGSYIEDHIKYDIGNTGKNRMGFGAVYALYRPSNFYILGDLVFGGGQFSVNRSIDIGALSYTAKGRPNHYQGLAYLEAGFDYNTCYCLVQPFLGFQGGYFRRNGVSETGEGPLNLNIHSQNSNSLFSRLGVHLTTQELSAFAFSVDLAWQYRIASSKRSITENFQDFGTDFSISGAPGNRSSFDAAATVSTTLCGGWELYAEVGGVFLSKTSSYNILGGVKYNW